MARKLVLSLIAIACFSASAWAPPLRRLKRPLPPAPMLPQARWHAIRVPISCLSSWLRQRPPLPTSRRLQ